MNRYRFHRLELVDGRTVDVQVDAIPEVDAATAFAVVDDRGIVFVFSDHGTEYAHVRYPWAGVICWASCDRPPPDFRPTPLV